MTRDKPIQPPLLLIEDTSSLRMIYKAVLTGAGHQVEIADDAQSGITAFRKHRPKLVILDLMLPDRCGLDLMRDILAQFPQTAVIVITANGSINKAVEAMRAGACDFLVKPFNETRLLQVVDNALASFGTQIPAAGAPMQPLGLIGTSPPMQAVYAKIQAAARSTATVFITGDSGTGKELCAQAVHDQSMRADGPFVVLNCGAIAPEMLESEVFGHLQGSFSGAITDKIGAAAAADGGTLFLDELCDLDLGLQAKLLRFLQSSTIQPVGSSTTRKVNVRIICATNRDPQEAVRLGQFRQDLYYRLHVVPIHMPPLRDRGDDILAIAQSALIAYAAEESRGFATLSEATQQRLLAYGWPGNVRQLLNVIRNIVVLNDGPEVTQAMLPPDLIADKSDFVTRAAPNPSKVFATGAMDGLLTKPLAEIERAIIEQVIAQYSGSVPKAARSLDVAASTLYRKLEAWGRDDAARKAAQ